VAERPATELSAYQREQLEALVLVRSHLAHLGPAGQACLRRQAVPYLALRTEMAAFLADHFSETCTTTCFSNRVSACCSRDGIITFFADVVLNVLVSEEGQVDSLQTLLERPHVGAKCVYLGDGGCRWRLKPIVCERFICDTAQHRVFGPQPALRTTWETLKKRASAFTWPDRPILFDRLEQEFIDAGLSSSLMYLHQSPGLLRVKRRAREAARRC
jgi:hypothetical protein